MGSSTANARRALSLLTVVPAGAWSDEEVSSATAAWFPAVGLLLGTLAYAVVTIARSAGWHGNGSLVLSAGIVSLWALTTRMLHWDGLADTADGLLGGATPARRLEIMHDSSNGSFATVAVTLVAIVQVAAVASIITVGLELVLVAAPALGRLAALFAAWLGAPVSQGSLGASVMGRPSLGGVVVAALWTGLSMMVILWALGAGVPALLVLAAVTVGALGVPHVLSGAVGGVNGDIMGASILLVESLCLVLVALTRGG